MLFFFFLMIRRQPRSTPKPSSAASDVYKRQTLDYVSRFNFGPLKLDAVKDAVAYAEADRRMPRHL
ncbi:putative cell surface protein [Lactobacillus rhamnosus GG] [Lacticaseibacillus rhamnosus]|nr:putative cell surface protein [Lactobacillus rhamnosus GG] [Lacticaseibacillus rhamnosus]